MALICILHMQEQRARGARGALVRCVTTNSPTFVIRNNIHDFVMDAVWLNVVLLGNAKPSLKKTLTEWE